MCAIGIGSNTQRVDGLDKVMGRPLYGADRNLARMAFATPVTATIGKGRIRQLDTIAAERVAGVLAILTYRNMDRLAPIAFAFAGGQAIQSHVPMQSSDILYRGEAIALIVAETPESAAEAASLVRADYDTLPFAVELDATGHTEVGQAKAAPYFPDFVQGNAAAAIDAAPVQIEATYFSAPQHQNPMELFSTVAEWRGRHLIVHEGTQAAQAMKEGLAIQFGLNPERVRVLAPYVGGGFGLRGSISPHTTLAAVAARRVNRPVKLTVPRAQMFHASSFRATTEHKLRIGADDQGRLLGGTHMVRAQTSRFDLMPFTGQETASRMYAWPTYRGATTLVRLDCQTPGFMRAPMEMASFFALESAMDELAEKIGLDPVTLRIQNDAKVDPITGKRFSSRHLTECLQRGAALFGWKARVAMPGSMRLADGTRIGYGVAAGAYPGYIAPALAKVRLNSDGRVDVSVGGHEMGQGIRTAIALVLAEELGVDPQTATITIGDTQFPPQHVTSGSTGAATISVPVRDAAIHLRNTLATLATQARGIQFDNTDATSLKLDGAILIGSDGRSERIADILRHHGLDHVDGEARGSAPGMKPDAFQQAALGKVAFSGPEFPNHVAFSFIAQFVEVHIAPRMPRPRVVRMVSVVDCGRVLSRRTATSQLYGGLVWGIGAALSEASEVDPRYGGFLNNNIAEYQVAVNADVRRLQVEFIDVADTVFCSVGAKGVGEVACVGAAAAIANAVHHATGKRIRHLPIRMDDLI
jgi:xanthine dehydrogenase YagR molybdenum-binding subunit